jgi:hypothetical protein
MRAVETSRKAENTYFHTDHGGVLRNTRKGRGARALTNRHSMHLVLRSSQATGKNAFNRGQRKQQIARVVYKHASRNGIQMISFANAGNHLHLHIHLGAKKTVTIRGQTKVYDHRQMYCRFIRAITGAIALMVMSTSAAGVSLSASRQKQEHRFWDLRPFTRHVSTSRHFVNMREYMEINKLEGQGFHRINARLTVAFRYDQKHPPDMDDS